MTEILLKFKQQSLCAVGQSILLTFELYCSTVYEFHACFGVLSTFECHFDKSPSSKIVFLEPYQDRIGGFLEGGLHGCLWVCMHVYACKTRGI